jgi:protein TonB
MRNRSTEPGARWTGAALAVGLHALALGALLSYAPARNALLAAAPIMVSLVTQPRPEEKPQPRPETPPQPKPLAKPRALPPQPLPVLTAPAESPALVAAPPPPSEPPPPQPIALPAAPPVVITEPIFNANYLDNPAPEYPWLSRRAGEQGRVLLRVLVNAAGRAQDVEVRTSSGFLRLDQTARDTVRAWRFVPAKRGNEPVPAWVLIPIVFKLDG